VAPLLLGTVGMAARGGRGTAIALAGVAVAWCAWAPAPVRSNVRAVAGTLYAALGAGDVVVVSAPEDVPVVFHYLPAGARYVIPAGPVEDPRVTDWRDLVTRLRRARTRTLVARTVGSLGPGQHLVLVAPLFRLGFCCAPLKRVIGFRQSELQRALARDHRLRRIAVTPGVREPHVRSQVQATTYVRVEAARTQGTGSPGRMTRLARVKTARPARRRAGLGVDRAHGHRRAAEAPAG